MADETPAAILSVLNAVATLARCAVDAAPFGNVVRAGYLPFLKADGAWDQKGIIRVWRFSDGRLVRRSWDSRLDIAVTSNVAFAPNGGNFVVGSYDGTTLAAVNQ